MFLLVLIRGLGALLALLSFVILAFTASWAVPVIGLGFAIVLLGYKGWHKWAAIVAVLCLASGFLVRGWNFDVTVEKTRALSELEPGQYSAKSDDLLKLVTVRVVIRQGGHLIFAEAHALPAAGLDPHTLQHEPHRALFYQALPPEPDERTDPLTARLVHNAMSKALSGEVARQKPTLPEGARRSAQGGDTYWGMFPSEFDHRCSVNDAPDGRWVGQSSNPAYPATVALTIQAGRIQQVEVLDHRASYRGDKALTELPAKVVAEQNTNIDVISGATRTSLILRSAVFHACQEAHKPANP